MVGKNTKVSLIVPVYNVDDYLGKCLNSCQAQTLNDLEMIFVDDGSTDNSGAILDEFASIESRAVVIHKENGGLSSARNAGMRIASGEWIMFLDSDDYLAPNACERIWLESIEERTDIIVYGSEYFPKYPEPKHAQWLRNVLYTRTHRFYDFQMSILLYEQGAKPFVWRQAFSTDLLRKNTIEFNEELRFAEDIHFQFITFPCAKNISFIQDTLYFYRVNRSGSLMQKMSDKQREKYNWHLKAVDLIFTDWNETGLISKYGAELLGWALKYAIADLNIDLDNEQATMIYDVICSHGLDVYADELPIEERKLWTKVRKRAIL